MVVGCCAPALQTAHHDRAPLASSSRQLGLRQVECQVGAVWWGGGATTRSASCFCLMRSYVMCSYWLLCSVYRTLHRTRPAPSQLLRRATVRLTLSRCVLYVMPLRTLHFIRYATTMYTTDTTVVYENIVSTESSLRTGTSGIRSRARSGIKAL